MIFQHDSGSATHYLEGIRRHGTVLLNQHRNRNCFADLQTDARTHKSLISMIEDELSFFIGDFICIEATVTVECFESSARY